MFIVLAISVLSWGILKKLDKPWLITVLVIGLATTFLVTSISTTLPPVEQAISADESYRTFPSVAYPFALEQYRDWDSGTYYYTIVFTGTHAALLQSVTQDDQSEFIHMTHLTFTAALGLLSLLGMIVPILLFVALEGLGYVKRDLSLARMDKRIGGVLAAAEIVMIVYLFMIWSVFTLIAGAGVLLLTILLTLFPRPSTD